MLQDHSSIFQRILQGIFYQFVHSFNRHYEFHERSSGANEKTVSNLINISLGVPDFLCLLILVVMIAADPAYKLTNHFLFPHVCLSQTPHVYSSRGAQMTAAFSAPMKVVLRDRCSFESASEAFLAQEMVLLQ